MSPDKWPVFVNEAMSTNHQEKIESSEYASYTKPIERKEYLQEYILLTEIDKEVILNQF